MAEIEYTIQELCDASGVARRNIYFYTQQGILPPPEGAGLAARYREVHLLRLRAIPVLRSQGLRLDDIRKRLQSETEEGLRQIGGHPAVVREAQMLYSPGSIPLLEARTVMPGRSMEQFDLPGGVRIIAPSVMTPPESRRLSRLLEAARKIYFAPQLPHDGGKD